MGMGTGPIDLQEVMNLNRILRVTPTGLSYEGDPRHAELLARALGLETCPRQLTPGTTDLLDHDVANGVPEHDDGAKEEISKLICALKVKPRQSKIRFNALINAH